MQYSQKDEVVYMYVIVLYYDKATGTKYLG